MARSVIRLWKTSALLCVALAGNGCVYHKTPVFPTPVQSPQQVLDVWMAKNCKVGEENDLERAMRKFGQQLTPLLKANFERGPTEDRKREISEYTKSELIHMQETIRKGDALRLPAQDSARIVTIDPEAYAKRSVEDFVLSFKSTALAGLGAVRTPDAVVYLQQQAFDTQSEFQELARAILVHLKKKMPEPPGKPQAR